MFSKKRLLQILMGFSLANPMWLGGCSDFLDEKHQEPQALEMANTKFTCLQSLPVQMTEFLKGQVSDAEIDRGFDCAKDALLYFKSKTKGTYPDAYSMEDLRNVFGKYFLKKNNVSPEFGTQLFKLKKVLLGGTDYSITQLEIQRLVDLLESVKKQAHLVAPHVTLLMGRKDKATWSDVDRGIAQLQESLWTLFKEVDLVRSDYSFSDLKKFMNGLSDFINVKEPFLLTAQFDGDVELVEAVKNILVGEEPHFDNLNDWHSAVATVANFYKEVLRYRYFLKENDLTTPASVQNFLLATNDVLTLLENCFSMQHRGVISFSSIDHLLALLEARKHLPLGLSSVSLGETYKKAVLRVLDPWRRGDARGLQGLERVHVLSLKHELKIYQLHQNVIDNLPFDPAAKISFADLKNAAEAFNPMAFMIKSLTAEGLELEILQAAWKEGRDLLLKPFPVFYNEEGRQVVVTDATAYRQSWRSLTKWNLMRALSRLLLIGYGKNHNPEISKEVMKEAGLEQWYTDFNQIGIELKAFDSRSLNSGVRSFKEANFFTFKGNGDSLMDYNETFDFVSLLVSGGRSSADFIREDLLKLGCGLSATDIFGYPWMNEICFKKALHKKFAAYFNNLPGMVREVSGMAEEQWIEFYDSLMTASRVSAAAGGRVETADLRTAVMILHYVESLMSVYDTNNDGKLNIKELRVTSGRFLELMRAVSPLDTKFVVEDFFLFLVYKGHKPTLSEYTYFQGEKAFGSLKDVGRDKVLRVFKVLKDEKF